MNNVTQRHRRTEVQRHNNIIIIIYFYSMVYIFVLSYNNFDASFLLINIESGFPTDHHRVYLPWQLGNHFMKYKYLITYFK